MKPTIGLLLLQFVCLQSGFAQHVADLSKQTGDATALMQGKDKTDRTIFLEATINAAPGAVFRLWTSAEGIKKFFAPDARIDARPGGRYQVIFFPSKDPEGNSHETKGARILKLVPDRELAFEWITFAGDNLLGKTRRPSRRPRKETCNHCPPGWSSRSIPSLGNRTRRILSSLTTASAKESYGGNRINGSGAPGRAFSSSSLLTVRTQKTFKNQGKES